MLNFKRIALALLALSLISIAASTALAADNRVIAVVNRGGSQVDVMWEHPPTEWDMANTIVMVGTEQLTGTPSPNGYHPAMAAYWHGDLPENEWLMAGMNGLEACFWYGAGDATPNPCSTHAQRPGLPQLGDITYLYGAEDAILYETHNGWEIILVTGPQQFHLLQYHRVAPVFGDVVLYADPIEWRRARGEN